MIKIINYFGQVFAGLNCMFCNYFFYKRLKILMPSICYSFSPFLLYSKSNTLIGKRAIISKYCKIICKGKLSIGDNFFMNKYSRIVSFERILIGNNVTIAQFVTILDHDHAYNMQATQLIFKGYKTSPIKIGDNVWIGDKVTICKGVNIGNNVIIGANSVVTRDIPSNYIVAGSPARLIKEIYE